MINLAAITPHPPIAIPGIGRKKDLDLMKETIQSLDNLRSSLEKKKPDLVFIISPHSITFPDAFGLNSAKRLEGDLSMFGLSEKFSFENDLEMIKKIENQTKDDRVPARRFDSLLDHGVLVPAYYLLQKSNSKMINASFSFASPQMHFEYGKKIGAIFAKTNKKIAVIASADLSHRLSPDAPAGYSPQGQIFDEKLIQLLEENKLEEIVKINENLRAEAGECGYRSILIVLGIISQNKYQFKKLAYQAPFGVGYLTGKFLIQN